MFQVDWIEAALDDLTLIWTQADSSERQAITAASHAIDQRLRSDPVNEGESRSAGRRILFAPPLTVTYQLEPDGRTVTVLHVRIFHRRP